MESPDLPWARNEDARIKKRFETPPSPAVIFFLDYIKANCADCGRKTIDIGCGTGRNAIYLACKGFEVHGVDQSDEVLADIDLHGVMPHCHSIFDCWLFGDSFFDFAMDILCYSGQADDAGKITYRGELSRVLKEGGYYLLSVPMKKGRKELLEKEFAGFEIIASEESEDAVEGERVRTLNLIMKKK